MFCTLTLLFFFSSRRRHTRSYGDWSSDVCSSDLHTPVNRDKVRDRALALFTGVCEGRISFFPTGQGGFGYRSEERRVGKECRSRWSTDHEKKKTSTKGYEDAMSKKTDYRRDTKVH